MAFEMLTFDGLGGELAARRAASLGWGHGGGGLGGEILDFQGLRQRRKGSKRVCGCRVQETRRRRQGREVAGTPLIVCPGGIHRFASRAEAVALFGREQSTGSFCIFAKRPRRGKRRGKRR